MQHSELLGNRGNRGYPVWGPVGGWELEKGGSLRRWEEKNLPRKSENLRNEERKDSIAETVEYCIVDCIADSTAL